MSKQDSCLASVVLRDDVDALPAAQKIVRQNTHFSIYREVICLIVFSA